MIKFVKKIWQKNYIVRHDDANRWEAGIADAVHGLNEHANDTNNPHELTIEQIPELKADLNNRSLTNHTHPLQTTVSGNAGTATRLQTPRTISLTGSAIGSANFDGSANIAMAVTVPPNGHIHGFDQLKGEARLLPRNADLNTVFDGGFYRIETPINRPSGGNIWWYLQVIQYGTAGALQIITSSATPHEIWMRSAWSHRDWSSWSRPDARNAERLQTARSMQIGNTTRGFNGTADVRWTLADIGAFPMANVRTGVVTITPIVNQPTSVLVAYGATFSARPQIALTAHTAFPGSAVRGVSVNYENLGVGNNDRTHCRIWINRSDAQPTNVQWIAIL